MDVRAPAVIKLFGEHAVVYGKTAVAMAVDLYAGASAEGAGRLSIALPDIGKSATLPDEDLHRIYGAFSSRESIGGFISGQGMDRDLLPFASIAAALSSRHGARLDYEVTVTSDIPVQKGLASSAACSTAFLAALVKAKGLSLPDGEFMELARIGEMVQHANENSGFIDVSTSYYGGFVSFSAGSARRQRVPKPLSLLLVDTGPKKKTSEMVEAVRSRYESDPVQTIAILDEIDSCGIKGIEALGSDSPDRLEKLGSLMYDNQESLARLGVSSGSLDTAVRLARVGGAYGAKLSGGGGGGMAVILPRGNPDPLKKALEGSGFHVSEITTSFSGARDFMQSGAKPAATGCPT